MNVTASASRPQHEHGAAVREVVRGRARRRRADHPVARDGAEILAADRPRELDHPAERRARRDDVVDGDVALAVELHLERRQLDDVVLAGEDARDVALEGVRLDRREEADAAEVDADHRHVAAEQLCERAQDRAVAAEHDASSSRRRLRARRRALDARGARRTALHALDCGVDVDAGRA